MQKTSFSPDSGLAITGGAWPSTASNSGGLGGKFKSAAFNKMASSADRFTTAAGTKGPSSTRRPRSRSATEHWPHELLSLILFNSTATASSRPQELTSWPSPPSAAPSPCRSTCPCPSAWTPPCLCCCSCPLDVHPGALPAVWLSTPRRPHAAL